MKIFDLVGLSLMIAAFGLLGMGADLAIFYAFAWPCIFVGEYPLFFRLFSGVGSGAAFVGMGIGTIRIILYQVEGYRERQ